MIGVFATTSFQEATILPKTESMMVTLRKLDAPDDAIKRTGIKELGTFGKNAEKAVPELKRFCGSLNLSYAVVETLRKIGTPNTAKLLIEIIKTDTNPVLSRTFAISGLKTVYNELDEPLQRRAIETLEAAFLHGNPDVSNVAEKALTELNINVNSLLEKC